MPVPAGTTKVGGRVGIVGTGHRGRVRFPLFSSLHSQYFGMRLTGLGLGWIAIRQGDLGTANFRAGGSL